MLLTRAPSIKKRAARKRRRKVVISPDTFLSKASQELVDPLERHTYYQRLARFVAATVAVYLYLGICVEQTI